MTRDIHLTSFILTASENSKPSVGGDGRGEPELAVEVRSPNSSKAGRDFFFERDPKTLPSKPRTYKDGSISEPWPTRGSFD